ncbi:hypothetical protein M3Y98_01073200 [Aphelenchoides besseyi]|nr:hypothetical protein M3Y98_01073200 [Aphelenchoides besseyi]
MRPYVRQTFFNLNIEFSTDRLATLFDSIEIPEENSENQRTLPRILEKHKDLEVKVIERARENNYVACVDWKNELYRFQQTYAPPAPNEDEIEPIRIEEHDELDSNDELGYYEQKKG